MPVEQKPALSWAAVSSLSSDPALSRAEVSSSSEPAERQPRLPALLFDNAEQQLAVRLKAAEEV